MVKEKKMSTCSQCALEAEAHLSIQHTKCHHYSHVDCLSEPHNFELCPSCASGDAPKTPMAAAAAAAVGAQAVGGEPHTTDGRNYILYPGTKAGTSTLKIIGSWLSKQPEENVKTSQNPIFLLNNKVPIETIMRQNKLGLDHFLKAGVTMDDFLKNNYSWNDLMKFEYLQKGGKRAFQTLTIGLKANANHFRDYPDLFPPNEVQSHIGFKNADYCKSFGLEFDPHGPLMCNGDDRWSANDCLALGLNIDDLIDFGLVYIQQYEDLMTGLTPSEAQDAEKNLRTTVEHLKQLKDANEEVVVQHPVAAPVAAPPRSVHEEHVAPVKIKQEQPRVVVIEKQVPVYIKEPVFIPAPGPARTNAPATLLKPYERRGAEKFSRHGALIK
ncbi:MAG: hypothetical protein K2Q45_00330 [Nitrosomonas sp.]|nr:hypothetical protein [Nitrosomonas sp.]